MRSRPPTRAFVWSGLGALVGLWLGFAVVAGITQSAPASSATHARPLPKPAPVGFALTDAPALHVRGVVLGTVAVRSAPTPRRRHRTAPKAAPAPAPAPAMSAPVTPAPQTPVTNPVTPVTPTQQATPVQQAPAPRPVRRTQPTVVSKPKPSSGPDFDNAAPSGFDNSG